MLGCRPGSAELAAHFALSSRLSPSPRSRLESAVSAAWNPAVDKVVPPNATIEKVAGNLQFAEGPV
jgi:hypothetical protein